MNSDLKDNVSDKLLETYIKRNEHAKQYIVLLLLGSFNKIATNENDMYLQLVNYRIELDRLLNILEGKLSTGNVRTKEELKHYDLSMLDTSLLDLESQE